MQRVRPIRVAVLGAALMFLGCRAELEPTPGEQASARGVRSALDGEICPDGQEEPSPLEACRDCPPGTFSSGGAACVACDQGYYADGAASSCTACGDGFSTPGVGGTSLDCTPCAPGQISDLGTGYLCQSVGGGGAPSGVVGLAGIAEWDALPAAEQNKVKTDFRSFFLHQSVGGDLEDGARAVGFRFEYTTSSSTNLRPGLNGGLFSSSNGNPSGKIAEFMSMALANQTTVRVAIMKFGYADIVAGTVAGAQADYQAAVSAIKAAGVRVLHVTPPLVYNVPAENAPKMQMREWMMATFPDDVIFDLQDVESTEPGSDTRCERGGSWEICDSVRSTRTCPSLHQGIDAASGQGHICHDPHARRLAKAFLYSIYLAGQ